MASSASSCFLACQWAQLHPENLSLGPSGATHVQDEVGHSSSQWHVGYESPPQGRSEHGKAPPPTPPLAFKHSPDRFGTWRIRRENPSCEQNGHYTSALLPAPGDAHPRPLLYGSNAEPAAWLLEQSAVILISATVLYIRLTDEGRRWLLGELSQSRFSAKDGPLLKDLAARFGYISFIQSTISL